MEKQIRLCIISPLFHPDLGGVGRQAVLLTSKLKEQGIQLFVLLRKMRNIPEFKVPLNIDVHDIPAFRPSVHNLEDKSFLNFLTSLSFSLLLAYKLFIMRKQYNLVHFHGASLPLIICLPLLKFMRKKVIAKVLASGLGTEAGSLRGRYLFFENILISIMKRIDAFVAISREIENGLKNDGVLPEKIYRITNFVDTKKFSPASKEERLTLRKEMSVDEKIVINFTGRIVRRKGLDLLLNAFSEDEKLSSSAVIIVIGTGNDEDRIKELVSRLGILEKVRFIGQTNEVERYFKASDLFVLPSYQEGMPNSLLEAMACGLPVIASKIGGVFDVVEDGKSGILFEQGDVSALASAMVRLLNDNELRFKLGAEARKRIVENFSIDKIADEYINLYKEVLD